MPFKIAWLRLTGQLRPAEKIESEREELEKRYRAYLDAEKSEELRKYRELEEWVKSGAPETRKRELEALVFKGSREENQLKEFKSLHNSKALRNYFRIAGSPELKRFETAAGSEKMKKYWELKEYIVDGGYRKDKYEIESERFEGSVEQRKLRELDQLGKNRKLRAYLKLQGSDLVEKHSRFLQGEKLKRYLRLKNAPERDKAARRELIRLRLDPEIRSYFRFENSRELKYYREMAHSHPLARYRELLRETGTDSFRKRVAFLKDRKKLERSEAWKKYSQFKQLSADGDVLFQMKFEDSALYRNYLDLDDSFMLNRYRELKEIVSSTGFLERKAYLEDRKKWEKSEEYASLQEMERLRKTPGVALYYRYHQSHAFDFFRNWELSFGEDFKGKALDPGRWIPNTLWGDRLLGNPYSQQGDLQGYTGGGNAAVGNRGLVLSVKKENVASRQWIPGAGMVPADFGYSSDTLSTARGFRQQEGIYEAKIRFSPVRQVVSSFYLMGEKPDFQITLCETGAANRMGFMTRNSGEPPRFSGITLSPLRKNSFYLFRLEWEGKKLIWKINDRTVYESHVADPGCPVHLNLTSLVVDEIPASQLPVRFEVEWIRCYRKK